MIHDTDARAHLGELRQDMGADHDRLSHRMQIFQQFLHLHPRPRVKPGARLIQDQELWIVEQRPRHTEALLHTARERVHIEFLLIRKVYKLQKIICQFGNIARPHPVHGTIEIHILMHLQIVIHPEKIRHITDQPLHLPAAHRRVDAADPHRTAARLEQAADNADRGRLPRAVRSHETKQVSLRYVKRQMVDRRERTVLLRQVIDI